MIFVSNLKESLKKNKIQFCMIKKYGHSFIGDTSLLKYFTFLKLICFMMDDKVSESLNDCEWQR